MMNSKALLCLSATILLASCASKKEVSIAEETESRKIAQARAYEVGELQGNNLVELFGEASNEAMRLLDFIEQQELFLGLNPVIPKSKRGLKELRPEANANSKEWLYANQSLLELIEGLSEEDSFRSEYRRKFRNLYRRYDSRFRKLK